jgi:putative transposase
LILAHKIALDPNDAQVTYFARAAGTARFAYNWALAEWQRQHLARKADPSLPAPSEAGLRRQMNALKPTQFPWMLDVTKNAPQQAIKNLGTAFKRFFAGQGKYPQFKRKGIHDSFRADGGPGTFIIDKKRIRLPVVGWVCLREPMRFAGRLLSATVSRLAGRWFVSVQVETVPDVSPPENQGQAVGVDLGVKALATLSDGTSVAGPKALRYYLAKLKRLSRSLSRKARGSANRRKAKARLATLHARIANIRKDSLHKLTTDLIRRFQTIVIEDLNVRGMMANGRLSRAIADMGFHEFRRQLGYKAKMQGRVLVTAPRFYPSSKTCSGCGHRLEALALSIREWTCPACGAQHDRDHNAAVNLEKLAASSAVAACGEESAGFGRKAKAKLTSVKQESSTKPTDA